MGTTPVIKTETEFSIRQIIGTVFLFLGAPLYLFSLLGVFGAFLGLVVAWALNHFPIVRKVSFYLHSGLLVLSVLVIILYSLTR